MNKSEDYLDQLLKGMSGQDEIETELKEELEEDVSVGGTSEEETFEEDAFSDDILADDDSEEDLFDVDEEFLKEFELEMQKLETDSENPFDDIETEEIAVDDDAWDSGDLDQILTGAKEQMEALEEEPDETVSEVSEETGEVEAEEKEGPASKGDFSLDDFSFEDLMKEEPLMEEPLTEESTVEEPVDEEPVTEEPKEDEDVLKILAGLGDINLEEEMEAEAASEIEPEIENVSEMEPEPQPEELTDANISLLKELDDIESAEEPAPEEDKKKKREKKKKEKKEKKPKQKKEKKPKPKKEKKPKPPKEPDNTPPLPKKPVFMIFLLVASVVVLIMIGTNLFGYANQMKNARNAYAKKNYSEAFSYISGLDVKEKDEETYHKYQVMALVSSELEAYESFMDAKFYDLALDCLVRTVGRYEKYKEDAEIYGCIDELNALELEAETILSETFGVSKEEALDFYSYKSRKEYSAALLSVIEKSGMIRVTEE